MRPDSRIYVGLMHGCANQGQVEEAAGSSLPLRVYHPASISTMPSSKQSAPQKTLSRSASSHLLLSLPSLSERVSCRRIGYGSGKFLRGV